jgi:hypothetical protein
VTIRNYFQNISLHALIVQEFTVVFKKLLQMRMEFCQKLCIYKYQCIDSCLKNRKVDFSKGSLVEVNLEYVKVMVTSKDTVYPT